MISDTRRGLNVLRALGAIIALAVALFVHMVARIYAGEPGAPGSGRITDGWVAAPILLFAVALLLSVILALLNRTRAAKIAAFASVVWPPCVLVALVLNVHFLVPALVVGMVLIVVASFLLRATRA